MPTYSVYVSASDAESVEKHRNPNETTTQAFGRIIKEKSRILQTSIFSGWEPDGPAIRETVIMKMEFHFVRIADSDITVEGSSIADCTQKAIELRAIECMPTKIQGEVKLT